MALSNAAFLFSGVCIIKNPAQSCSPLQLNSIHWLLDEPENSLSPTRQQELLKFIEDSARFFGFQFIISTHSPFLLSMKGAKIYDMDEDVADVKRWSELPNVRIYYDFFKKHEKEFEWLLYSDFLSRINISSPHNLRI